MFKLKKIICLFVLLSSIVPISTVHASFGFQTLKPVSYKGLIAENQNEAYQKFLERYYKLKNGKQLIFDEKAGNIFRENMMKEDAANVGPYREAISKQIENTGIFFGGCREFSALISKFLTDVGIENYLLHILEIDPQYGDKSIHVANLIRLDNKWIVVDATLELQWTNDDSSRCLNIPLDKYVNYLVHKLNFSVPYIGVQSVNPEDKIKASSSIPLEQIYHKSK